MQNIKESASELIKKIPEDYSFKDVQYKLYIKSKIETELASAEHLQAGSFQPFVKRRKI